MSENETDLPVLDEETVWEKVKRTAKKAGREVIKLVLTLVYVLGDEDTPMSAKAIVLGALGYFVSPVDAIPDFLPGGFVDDLAVLTVAAVMVLAHIKTEHRERAEAWCDETFGPEQEETV